MKNTNQNLRCLSLLALLAAGLGLTGCVSDERSMAEQWGDRQVAREVKRELAKDPLYRYSDVVPLVRDGTVQLTGFVDTQEQRQRAAQLASHAKGATEIINIIQLKPTPTGRLEVRHQVTNAPASTATETTQPAEPAPPQPSQEPKPNP